MMYLPSIEDGQQVRCVDSSEDEIDEGVEIKTERKRKKCTDFDEGFVFECASSTAGTIGFYSVPTAFGSVKKLLCFVVRTLGP